MGRRSVLAVVAAIAVLSAVIGWAAGQRIKSPAEIAAEKQAPEPSLITVPVESRVLSQNVVVRGTVKASDATEVVVASASGASIISRLPLAPGDAVDEGDVIVEVSGRPVIALQGQLPAFRNLIPTLEGPDVRQLEEALARQGYSTGAVDGLYDGATASAVAALYRDAGYTPAGEGTGTSAEVKAARDGVAAAQSALDSAQQDLTEGQAPLTDLGRTQLDQAVTGAQIGLDKAKLASTTTKAEAAAAVTAAETDKNTKAAASTTATDRLAQAKGGTNPDTNQAPTTEELAQFQAEADAAAAEAAAAVTALDTARSSADITNREQDLAVAEADSAVREAQTTRSSRLAGTDTSALRSRVTEAQKALTDAKADLTEAQGRAGAQLVATEVLFLPTLPREVQTVGVEVGDAPSGAVMTISGSDTIIESGLSSADRRLVNVGDEALLEEDSLGISIKAVVTFVADNPGGPDLSADRYAMRLEPAEDVPEDALNVNLRISIPISSSGGEVMSVPFAALSAGANGSARVEVERTPGQTELVEVAPGLRAEGYVEVKTLGGASLAVGDRVVVGRDLELPGATGGSGDSSKDSSKDSTGDGTDDTSGGSDGTS